MHHGKVKGHMGFTYLIEVISYCKVGKVRNDVVAALFVVIAWSSGLLADVLDL